VDRNNVLCHNRPDNVSVFIGQRNVIGVAAAMFPYVPVNLMLKDRFESDRYVKGIKAKSIILAAERDSIVPEWSTKALHAVFGKDKVSYTVITDSDHSSFVILPFTSSI
jgi:hypothetical protein